MKRFLAILLSICIIISAIGSVVVFAEDTAVTDGNGETDGDTVVSTLDSAKHEHMPLDDTADQIVYVDPDEITVEVKKELLNSAELHPMTTGYEPLDNLVAEIHSKIFTPTMDTYEKVCAIYKYLMTDTYYGYSNQTALGTYNRLYKTHNYKSKLDYIVVYASYGLLVENYGACNHYSSAFMVMTRALGLESYLATCTSSIRGLGGHYSAMMRLNGHLYRFDPVMGVVTDKRDVVEDSEFFCTPMVSQVSSEFSYLEEQVACFGNFEMYPYGGSISTSRPEGKTEGDVRFTFGSYPQTEIKDENLIEQLNEQLNGVTMNYYPYTCGSDEPGSQERCEYMSWADITYNNEKYRAVKIDEYRPKYIYRTHEKKNSQQFRVGYDAGNIYWFKFEPIEWRLADGNNLLIADLALDSQPFNDSLYYSKKGKRINGKTCYVFNDEEMTHPANDWEYSSIRRWLNDDFYNTAFTEKEQQLILDSQLKASHSYLNFFEYNETTDKVFLLSYSEVLDSDYYIAADNESRQSDSSDYARSQGVTYKRNDDTYGYSTACLLRTPGMHSGDVTVITNRGVVHEIVSAGSTNAGIRPALRAEPLSLLFADMTEAPDKPKAYATDTGQITVRSNIVNGVDGYKFYVYTDDETKPDAIYTSSGPIMVINDLIPGKVYRFRSSAYRLNDNEYDETPLSEMTELLCRTLVEPPDNIMAEPVSTSTVRLSFEPVDQAVEYRVYRYTDSDTLDLCAVSSDPVIDVTGLRVGTPYSFKVTSVSDDGYESKLSTGNTSCVCESFPKRPEDVRVEPYATGKLQISWSAVDGAASYNVYRYYVADDLELIRSTSDTSIIVSDLTTNSSYYYKVEAIGEDSEDVSTLSALTGNTCLSIPPVPKGVKVEAYATRKLQITWGAVEGAATYNVYRYFTAKGLVLLGSTDEPSYIVSDLITGGNCFFRVEAVSEDGKDISDISALAGGVCESIPPIPTNVQVQPYSTDSLEVSWDAVGGAATYNVYRYLVADGLKLVGTTSDTSLVVSGLKPGDNCFFRVEAVSEDSKDISEYSDLAGGVCESVPPVPQNVRVLPSGTGRLTVSWDASQGADIYNVYRFYSKTNSEFLGRTTDTSFEVSGYKTGDRVFFQVEAATADGKNISSLSTLESGVCESFPPVPQNIVAYPSSTGCITVTWDAAEGAGAYNVYRYFSASKTELLCTTEETSYEMKDLNPGASIYFKIQSVSADGKDIGSMSSAVNAVAESIPPVPANLTVTASNRPLAADLRWDPAEGATGYEIYKYDDVEKIYTLYGKTEKTEFEAVGLKGGSQARFAVAAVKEDEDFVHVSLKSNSAAAVVNKLAVPDGVTAAATGTGEVTLSWAPVPFADRYDVFIYDSVYKVYNRVGSSKDNECTLRSLKTDVTSTFRVAAVCEFDTYELSSDYSASVNCKVLSGPDAVQQLSAAQLSGNTVRLNWSAVKEAARYNIYAVSPIPEAEDELLGTTDTTSFTTDSLTKGRLYRIYVRAVKMNGEYSLTGDPSNVVVINIPAEEPYIIGDADGGGSVDIVDATFVQRYSTGIKVPVDTETLMHADIDRDGTLSVVDATFIQRYVTFIFVPYLIDCPSV